MVNNSISNNNISENENHELLLKNALDDANKKNELSFMPNYLISIIFFLLLSVIIFIFLLSFALPKRGTPWVAPWYIWVSDIVLFIISFIIFKGYSSLYSLNLKSRKIVKKYNFFSIKLEKPVVDFTQIKLIGISTIVDVNTNDKKQKIVEYKAETIAIYRENNKLKKLILEEKINIRLPTIAEYINTNAEAAAQLIGCNFIPYDGTSKIVLKDDNPYQDNIESQITLVPKEQQHPEIDFKVVQEENLFDYKE